jgi:hypothetical protein
MVGLEKATRHGCCLTRRPRCAVQALSGVEGGGKRTGGARVNKRADTLLKIAARFSYAVESPGSWVTVGELKSAERSRFANSIRPLNRQAGNPSPKGNLGVEQPMPRICVRLALLPQVFPHSPEFSGGEV